MKTENRMGTVLVPGGTGKALCWTSGGFGRESGCISDGARGAMAVVWGCHETVDLTG